MLDVQKYLFFVINVQKQQVSGNIVDTYNMKILQNDVYNMCHCENIADRHDKNKHPVMECLLTIAIDIEYNNKGRFIQSLYLP